MKFFLVLECHVASAFAKLKLRRVPNAPAAV